jgi:methylase of polypeptide subunit release factors
MPERQILIGGHRVVEVFDDTHGSDQATRYVARYLQVAPGAYFCEVGCGTGALALLAARSGAGRVVATDVDSHALALLQAAARRNGVPALETREGSGSLLEPVLVGERLDVVAAVLPQKPARAEFDVRYSGGPDGADLLVALIGQAAERLAGGGMLWLYHHSLAAPARVEVALSRSFAWACVAERLRYCASDSYDALAPGMLRWLTNLVEAGTAQAWRRGPYLVWRGRVLRARRL